MNDCKDLELAREWAEWAKDNPSVSVGHIRDLPRAAADLIASLPDTIVDGDKLREVVADHHIDMSEELMEALGALLPDPRTMAEIEWDDEEHRFAGAETENGYELVMLERRWVEGHPDLYVILCVDLEGSVGTWIPGHITPTGRKYRLEPEDDTPTSPIEDEPAPESDAPRPEDVPVGEPWQVEIDGREAIGYRHDPRAGFSWTIVCRDDYSHDWACDSELTLIARLVPETTETESYPAYTYLDKDGDEWEYIDGGWFTGDTHAKRAAKREHHSGRASLPAEYGPYTRITEEESDE